MAYRNSLLRLGLLLVYLVSTTFRPVPSLANGGYVVQIAQVQTEDYPNITLYVDVTNTSGQRVANLQKSDFSVTEDGQPVDIVDFAGVGDQRPVDVVFVFDTTGSMAEQIEGVKDTCIAFANELESKGRDYRLGLVTFWDEIRDVRGPGGELAADATEFKGWIEALRAEEGGDTAELALDALVQGSQMRFRPEAQRVLILITDAPPHHRGDELGYSALTIDETLQKLEAAHVTLFAVAPDLTGLNFFDQFMTGLPAENLYKQMADRLGGKFYDIDREPDFSGVIEEIGAAIATQYRLTYRSPRPTYDGTRRDIQVEISDSGTGSGGSGTSAYLEQHLLNIQSNPVVGGICLLPLLLLLAAPTGLRLATKLRSPISLPQPTGGQPSPSATPTSEWKPSPISPRSLSGSPSAFSPPLLTCPHCGGLLRPGAKFCAGCGRSTLTPEPRSVSSTCPNCGYSMRSEAKFCGRCGYKKG